MSSKFVPVTCPDKAWEYRQAGMLYWDDPDLGWTTATAAGVSKAMSDRWLAHTGYAILVEEEG